MPSTTTIEEEIVALIPKSRSEKRRVFMVGRVCELVGIKPDDRYSRLPKDKKRRLDQELAQFRAIFGAEVLTD